MSQLLFLVPLMVLESPPEPPEATMMRMAFGAAAMGVGLAALVVPKSLFKNAVLAQRIPLTERPDPEALPGFHKTVSVVADPDATIRSLLPAFQVRTILGCALCEAITLLGFVQKFLGFGWEVAAPFFVLGIGLTVIQLPTESKLVSAIEDVLGVPLHRS
jgi:hypothetical protein